MRQDLEQLLVVAERQTLAAFDKDISEGKRNPLEETPDYLRRRRNYATWSRMDTAPEEARELAAQLLANRPLSLDEAERAEFELAVTRMLVRLYDQFLERATRNQGSR